MKKLIAIILLLALLVPCALADAAFSHDLNGDGAPEAIVVRNYAEGTVNMLSVEATSEGKPVFTRVFDLFDSKTYGDGYLPVDDPWDCTMMLTPDGALYLELRDRYYDAAVNYYEVYRYDGEAFVAEKRIYDPGNTSGYALFDITNTDELNGECVCDFDEIDDLQKQAAAALSDALSAYALSYVPGEMMARTKDMDFVFRVTDADFIASDELPEGAWVVVEGGDVFVRTGPGREYDELGALSEGDRAPYLNEQQDDERPVTWYKVRFEGQEGWVSSKYGKLMGAE